MAEDRSMLKTALTWTVVGILAIIAIKIALRLVGFLFGLLGMAVGLVGFLLFTVGPLVLVGWLMVKAWQAFTKEQPRAA